MMGNTHAARTVTASPMGTTTPATDKVPQSWEPSELTKLVLFCHAEADRIAIWNASADGAVDLPPERWPASARNQHAAYLRMAQLVHLVSLVEPEFRKLVKARIGEIKRSATLRDMAEEVRNVGAAATAQ